jgi:hypothetical protein
MDLSGVIQSRMAAKTGLGEKLANPEKTTHLTKRRRLSSTP